MVVLASWRQVGTGSHPRSFVLNRS